LSTHSWPSSEPADLSEPVRQLRCEVLALRQDIGQLRRENAELRQQVGYWKAMHTRAVQRSKLLEAELEQWRGENRRSNCAGAAGVKPLKSALKRSSGEPAQD
jgi:hypothetical protein